MSARAEARLADKVGLPDPALLVDYGDHRHGHPLLLHHSTCIPIHHATEAPVHARETVLIVNGNDQGLQWVEGHVAVAVPALGHNPLGDVADDGGAAIAWCALPS